MENYLNQLKNKFVQGLSQNKNFKNLVTEFNKLNSDLKSRGKNLNKLWLAEKDKTVKQAYQKYQHLLKNINLTQANMDKEVNKAIANLKKSATQIEKNLKIYKKMAMTQKTKVEKILSSRKKNGKKKKTATRKAPRRSKA